MKRYILQDGSAVVRSERGDWVRYADALAASCPQDSQEAFRAFLVRRGVAKFHSLYGAVAHEIEEIESQLEKSEELRLRAALDHNAILKKVQEQRDLWKGAVEEWKNQESIRNAQLLEEIAKLKNAHGN